MASIGNLSAKLVLDTTQFSSGASRAARDLGGLDDRFSAFSVGIGRVSGALTSLAATFGIVLSVRAFASAISDTMQNIDDLAKASDRLGVATEELAGLRHGAELAGVSADKLDTSMERFLRTLSTGSKAFEMLNLSAEELRTMDTADALGLVADRLNRVGNNADRVRIAMELFGRGGAEMINFLAEGSEGISAAVAEAERLGIAINRVDAGRIEAANDAMTRMEAAWEGVKTEIAIGVADPMLAVLDTTTEIVSAARELGSVFGDIGASVRGINFGMNKMMSGIAQGYAGLYGVLDALPGFETNNMELAFKALAAGFDARANQALIPPITGGQSRRSRAAEAIEAAAGKAKQQSLPALEKGTVAEYSARMQLNKTDKLVDIAQKQLHENKRAADRLDELAGKDEIEVQEVGIE